MRTRSTPGRRFPYPQAGVVAAAFASTISVAGSASALCFSLSSCLRLRNRATERPVDGRPDEEAEETEATLAEGGVSFAAVSRAADGGAGSREWGDAPARAPAGLARPTRDPPRELPGAMGEAHAAR